MFLNTTSVLLKQTKQEVEGSGREKEDLNKCKTKDNMSAGEAWKSKHVEDIRKLTQC